MRCQKKTRLPTCPSTSQKNFLWESLRKTLPLQVTRGTLQQGCRVASSRREGCLQKDQVKLQVPMTPALLIMKVGTIISDNELLEQMSHFGREDHLLQAHQGVEGQFFVPPGVPLFPLLSKVLPQAVHDVLHRLRVSVPRLLPLVSVPEFVRRLNVGQSQFRMLVNRILLHISLSFYLYFVVFAPIRTFRIFSSSGFLINQL